MTLIIITFISGCGSPKVDEVKQKEIKYIKTSPVENRIMSKRIVDNSDIEPILQVDQISETGGEIIEIKFHNGNNVKEGDVILNIKNEGVSSRYFKAKADMENKKIQMEKTKKFSQDEVLKLYNEAKSDYISTKGNLKSAEKDFEENQAIISGNEDLYKEGLISEKEYLEVISNFQRAKTNYDSLKNGEVQEKEATYLLYKKYVEDKSWKYDMAMSKADYELALAEYNAAKEDFQDLQITAKISGIISNMDIDPYQYMGEESFLFKISDNSHMKVEIGVPGKDISNIFIGKEVQVFIPDISQTVIGEVYEINPSANSETKKFKVKISIENNNGTLKNGMYSKIMLETNPKEVLTVPKEAIMVKDLLSYIAVVKNEVAEIIQIKSGMESDSLQEVISSNIKPGDKVVVQGQYLLENGDSVREVK
jgi:RND family efflux transporter MFP subunit